MRVLFSTFAIIPVLLFAQGRFPDLAGETANGAEVHSPAPGERCMDHRGRGVRQKGTATGGGVVRARVQPLRGEERAVRDQL